MNGDAREGAMNGARTRTRASAGTRARARTARTRTAGHAAAGVVGVAPAPPAPPAPVTATARKRTYKEAELQSADWVQAHVLQSLERDGVTEGAAWVIEVPSLLQEGPMCGVTAMAMASEALRVAGSKSGFSGASKWADDVSEVWRERALATGGSKAGEIFDPRVLEAMAAAAAAREGSDGMAVAVVRPWTPVELVAAVADGHPVLVVYDAEPNHAPGLRRGHAAHWALVVGFVVPACAAGEGDAVAGVWDAPACAPSGWRFSEAEGAVRWEREDGASGVVAEDALWVIARHGKSRRPGVWRMDRLHASSAGLEESHPAKRAAGEWCMPVSLCDLAGTMAVLSPSDV